MIVRGERCTILEFDLPDEAAALALARKIAASVEGQVVVCDETGRDIGRVSTAFKLRADPAPRKQ